MTTKRPPKKAPAKAGAARHVLSAPPAAKRKLESARAWIEDSKARLSKSGVEYHDIRGPLGYATHDVDLFEILLTHAEMESAWASMNKMFDDTKRQPDTWRFMNACKDFMAAWETSPRRTAKEHKAHFTKLATDLREVAARVVVEPEFGAIGNMIATVNPVGSLSDEKILGLCDAIDADPIDGMSIKTDADKASYVRFVLSDYIPDLYCYLNWIADHSERVANQVSISTRPHRDSAKRTFFVRHLSDWFTKNFGSRHVSIVAAVASAIFDECLTPDHVSKLIPAESELSAPFRYQKLPPLR